MLNYRTIAVIKRELSEHLFSKLFIVMTLAFPILIFGSMGVSTYLASMDNKVSVVDVVCHTSGLAQALEQSKSKAGPLVTIAVKNIGSTPIEQYVTAQKNNLLSEALTGIIHIPQTALADKTVNYYAKSSRNLLLHEKLEAVLNEALVSDYFSKKEIASREIAYTVSPVDIKGYTVSAAGETERDGRGREILAFAFAFLLFLSIMMTGQMVLMAVIQEKSDRVVEVVLSSVTAEELMTGKILGSAITALIQMLIWLSPVLVISSQSETIQSLWTHLAPQLVIEVSITQLVYLFANFFVGLLIFISLFAALGAIFDTPQDAQSGMLPLMLLLIIPFMIAVALLGNSSNTAANIAALLPISSIIVMPVKMTLVEVPVWQLLLTTVLNIATFLALLPVSGKIYRMGILITGKPKFKEVLRWLKQA